MTETLVTLAAAMVPEGFVTRADLARGVGLDGDVVGGALGQGVLKVKAPLALVLRSLPALFSRTTVPVSPEMVPPTE